MFSGRENLKWRSFYIKFPKKKKRKKEKTGNRNVVVSLIWKALELFYSLSTPAWVQDKTNYKFLRLNILC